MHFCIKGYRRYIKLLKNIYSTCYKLTACIKNLKKMELNLIFLLASHYQRTQEVLERSVLNSLRIMRLIKTAFDV